MKERKRLRLENFDYSSPNYYFVTICSRNKNKLFGRIDGEKMILSRNGEIVKSYWLELPDHFTNIELDEYIIMPNHFHGILVICAPVKLHDNNSEVKTKSFTLSQIIAFFKYQTTKKINEEENHSIKKIWQRSFYDRIIRNESELNNVRKYIRYNLFA